MTTSRHDKHDATRRLPTSRRLADVKARRAVLLGYLSVFLSASQLAPTRVSAGKPDDRPDKVIYEAPALEVPFNPRAAQTPVPTPVSIDMDDAYQESVNVHHLGELTAERIEAADQEAAQKYADFHPAPPRLGLSREIPFAPLSLENEDFLKTELEDGRSVWTLAIRSTGAYGIRVHFSNFDVGRDAVLVYGRGASGLVVRGPYTGRGTLGAGEFYAAPVPGDEVFVELTGHQPPGFEIDEIVHFDRDPFGRDQLDSGRESAGGLLSCHEDVNCHSSVPVNARKATGRMSYISGGTAHVCTGTLINDLDDETIVPYFLTARHCISSAGAASSLVVSWL